MNNDVPLIVPEVNPEEIANNNGIIANPNCSTIQCVLALNALKKKYKIKRIIYNTYQSISGAGKAAIDDYYNCINGWESTLAELEKKLERLIGLGGADAAAFSQVSSLGGDVAKYDASIQGIKISSIR